MSVTSINVKLKYLMSQSNDLKRQLYSLYRYMSKDRFNKNIINVGKCRQIGYYKLFHLSNMEVRENENCSY